MLPLLRRLEDTSSVVRKDAVLVLARKRDRRAVIPLMALIRDSSSEVRQVAVRALGVLGDQGAGPVLVEALDDSSNSVVTAALDALAALRYRPAVEPVIALFAHGPTGQRQKLALTLAKLGGEQAMAALARALHSRNLGDIAQRAMISAGEGASEEVVRLLADPRTPSQVALLAVGIAREARLKAAVPALIERLRQGRLSSIDLARSLGAIGDPAAQRPLLELLESPHVEVRRAALSALAGGLADKRAVQALLGVLNDGEHRIRLDATRLLGRIAAKSAAPHMSRLSRESDPELVRAAVEAIRRIGSPRSTPVLLKLLGHGDRTVRRLASQALAGNSGAQLGANKKPGLEVRVRRRCRTLDEALLSTCLQALGGVLRGKGGTSETRAYLFSLMGSGQPSAFLGALDALSAMAHGDIPGRLFKRYAAVDRQERRRILEALGNSKHHKRKVAGFILKALDDPFPAIRAAAASALGQLGARTALRALERASRDAHWTVQVNASAALAQLSRKEDAPLLRRLAAGRIPMVRANALRGLGRLKSTGGPDGDIFTRALGNDRYPWSRLNALRALLTLGFKEVTLAQIDQKYRSVEPLLMAMSAYDRDSRVRAACLEIMRRRKANEPGEEIISGRPAPASTWLGLYLVDHMNNALKDSPFLLVDSAGLVRVVQSNELGEAWLEGLPAGRSHVEAPLLSTLPTP